MFFDDSYVKSNPEGERVMIKPTVDSGCNISKVISGIYAEKNVLKVDDTGDGYYSILTSFSNKGDIVKFIDYLNTKYPLTEAYHDAVREGCLLKKC